MPVTKTLEPFEIQKLIDANSAPPLGKRNAAIILAGCYFGLSVLETSQISVGTLLSPEGSFYRTWVLPEHESYNGIARELQLSDNMMQWFEAYFQWTISKEYGLSNLSAYRGVDPNRKFILNDYGEPYKLTERKAGSGQYQPSTLNHQIKKMLSRFEIPSLTPSVLRNTFIQQMYLNGAGWKKLKLVTGIASKRTLESKVRPEERELEKVFKSLYSRVKKPEEW